MRAGRPTVLTLGPDDWADPKKSYLVQEKQTGTARRLTAVQQHLRSHRRRNVALARHLPEVRAERFQDEVALRQSEASFVDWPIGYDDLVDWYGKAEAELGVSADVEDQKYLGIYFPDGYQYPMPRNPGVAHRSGDQKCAQES